MKLLSRPEELILLSIWRLQDDAYCIPIRSQVSEITGEDWSLGSVYMPLERLTKKRLIGSFLSDKTPERGGRHKRIYFLTDDGKKALVRIREVESKMWDGIPVHTLETK